MWELTINPVSARLDSKDLAKLKEKLTRNGPSRKSPGNGTNAWEERGTNNVGGRTRVHIQFK
jgi:hypothetical protein